MAQQPRPAASNESVLRAALIGTAVAAAPFIFGAALAYCFSGSKKQQQPEKHVSPARDAASSSSPARAQSSAASYSAGAPSALASTAASPEASPNPRMASTSQQQHTAAHHDGGIDQCGNVLSTVNVLPPVDRDAPCFLGHSGALVLLGPAGGKSHLAASAPGGGACVIDAECWVSFRRAKRHLTLGGATITPDIRSWEHHVDMTALFFRAVVPVTLANLALGRVVMYNIIDDKSITLAAMFNSGVRQLFGRGGGSGGGNNNNNKDQQTLLENHRSFALFVPSHIELDARLEDRARGRTKLVEHFDNSHFNYAWHKAAHALIAGAAHEYALPLCNAGSSQVSSLVASSVGACPQRLLQLARDGSHVVHFEEPAGTFWTLLEVLPLQWALFKGPWPGLTPADGADSLDMAKEPPALVSWFIVPFALDLNEEALDPPAESVDVAAAVASTVTPPSDLRGATWLRQSGWVAPKWGAEPTPFRSILLLSRRREVLLVRPGLEPAKATEGPSQFKDKASAAEAATAAAIDYGAVTGARVKMLQPSAGGYSSSFIPTHHLSKPEFRGQGTSSSSSSATGEALLAEAAEPLRQKQSLSMSCVRSTNVTPAASPQRAASPPQQPARRRRAVIVFYGSFAPFHRGHLETLELARKTLTGRHYDVVGSYVVPVAQTWPKEATLECMKPWAIRAAIAQLCTSALGNVAVDFGQGFPNVCVESICQRVTAHFRANRAKKSGAQSQQQQQQSMFSPLTQGGDDDEEEDPIIAWVNGSDIQVREYMRWLMRETSNIFLLVLPRGSTEACKEELAERRKEADEFDGRMIVSDLEPKLHLSSTKIRRAVKEGRLFEAAEMIGNEAAASMFLWVVHEEEMGRCQPTADKISAMEPFVDLGFAAPSKKKK